MKILNPFRGKLQKHLVKHLKKFLENFRNLERYRKYFFSKTSKIIQIYKNLKIIRIFPENVNIRNTFSKNSSGFKKVTETLK